MVSAKRKQDSRPAEAEPADKPSVAASRPGKPGPVTTGDMQAVGATSPEQVRERRAVRPDEPPVEESPGDQMSG